MLEINNLNIHFLDKNPKGRLQCSIKIFNISIYKIPKDYLEDCREIENLKNSAIYFLINNINSKPNIYIGQATIRSNGNGVLARIKEHCNNNNKNFEYILILTKDKEGLDATELNFLEHSFTKLLQESNQCILTNKNIPSKGIVKENMEKDYTHYLDITKTIFYTLGLNIFEKKDEKTQKYIETNLETIYENVQKENINILSINKIYKKSNININAKGILLENNKFKVLKGSTYKIDTNPSLYKKIAQLREQCYKEKIIKNGIFLKDYIFTSPSYAASFILGSPSNGKGLWKNEKGLSLNEISDNKNIETINLFFKMYIKIANKEVSAKALFNLSTKKITLLKESEIIEKNSKSLSNKSKNMREIAFKKGYIKNGKLIKDLRFDAPSSAAEFITGTAKNGRNDFKNKDGKTLNELVYKNNMDYSKE